MRSSCFVASLSLIIGLPLHAQLRTLDPHQRQAREICKELVEINTVDSVGSVTKAAGISSVPRPDNAIYQLVDGLAKLSRFSFPVQLKEVSRTFFERTAALETPVTGSAMRAIVAHPSDSQTASANVNCRIVPTQTPEEVRATIARVVADTKIQITSTVPIRERSGAPPSSLIGELMDPVTTITHDMFGASIPVIPVMSTGATDGRFLRAAGIPTYGVSGLFGDPTDARAHGCDERMLVKSYFDGQEFLHRLVHQLASTRLTP